jgi:hypothetical protein
MRRVNQNQYAIVAEVVQKAHDEMQKAKRLCLAFWFLFSEKNGNDGGYKL